MDENEVVAEGTERLDKLESDIQAGRQDLKEMTHTGEPYLYEDDERPDHQGDTAAPPPEGAAADADAPPPDGAAADADAPPPPG